MFNWHTARRKRFLALKIVSQANCMSIAIWYFQVTSSESVFTTLSCSCSVSPIYVGRLNALLP